MSNQSLTSEVSRRICAHMNNDHKDALLAYAEFHGGAINPVAVEMISITSKSMQLMVDGQKLEIHFDHILKDSKDAHQTLIAMMKEIPK